MASCIQPVCWLRLGPLATHMLHMYVSRSEGERENHFDEPIETWFVVESTKRLVVCGRINDFHFWIGCTLHSGGTSTLFWRYNLRFIRLEVRILKSHGRCQLHVEVVQRNDCFCFRRISPTCTIFISVDLPVCLTGSGHVDVSKRIIWMRINRTMASAELD